VKKTTTLKLGIRILEFTSATRNYEKPGTYRIMVKVVDILGVDTSQ
jgi:hypothetical protein